MDVALVTGASSGIGRAIVKLLCGMDYTVYGLARDFSKTDFSHERFFPVVCDITRMTALMERVEEILQKAGRLDALINNAGVGYFGPHETIRPERIEEMVRTNLLAPMALTQATLRALKASRGFVINIASTAALHPGRFGCAYAATKAGLSQFGLSLFDEVRKSGVRVVTIYPDMTRTGFYDRADFEPGDDPECHITPECVADAVAQAMRQPEGAVVTQMVIRPQRVQVNRKRP